ncbi:ribulose bisphosphate carboxylase small chain 3A [Trifolium pratense]|uniref:Ribulose bisphosphate carboxylase small chain 3A n=3 Tax=Trifolium pratense TaxID=57577 RepID=A0A2K3N010_TRIPR|nr:ribulose bisphosphate carboxylase small chain 3A [Trifolium pratense]
MAIITLGQFYDPPLRCFTFQDFQLAPTLEEFAKILGCDLKDCGPYLGLGENPTMEDIAKSLYLPCKEVSSWLETRKDDKKNDIKGFSRSVLETKAQALLAKKDWKPFNAVLALLVYGLVLFPNKENFVDFSAIGVFIAKNPVSALLADFYHSLYIRHEKRKGTISCCVPLVQKWLMSHLPKKGAFVENPASSKWSHRMMALTEKDISWYSRSLDGTEIILSCGDFPNVPLMGTKGCINYNPVLALRQLGYPMKGKPDDHLLKEFILKEGEEDPALLRRIRRAWNQVHKKALCKKNCIANPLYTQWVRERVAINQLPFDMVVKPSSPEPITVVPVEEAKN